ncbi:formyltransferase family protein [Rhodococcus gannanensis]|uniref:Formyltransferase family protein n=1 Tax=Rhodococcus gannanensis TaxID=1960308 RepID=A0ABW4P4I6_9NOCA
MIFIGRGALLWRAVRSAQAAGHPIDLVWTDPDETVPDGFPVLRGPDVNSASDDLLAACTDDIVWSVNNSTILRAPIVESGLRVLNIHNGPLPAYRGRPEIAVVRALLAGESRYAATLHEVDLGVDTGAVLAVEEFDIGPEDTFQDVMMAGLRACHTVFERSLPAVVAGKLTPLPPSGNRPGYHGLRDLADIAANRDDPRYARASALGVFAPHYPELAAALAGEPRP